MQMRYALGQLQAYQGNLGEAIQQWEAAYAGVGDEIPAAVPQLEEALGTAYLHKSEMENDVYRAPGDRCLFPPKQSVAYTKPADSQKAIEYSVEISRPQAG